MTEAKKAEEIEALIAEIEQLPRRRVAPLPTVTSVFWGGGTPSLLPPDAFARVHAAIGRAFGWRTGDREAADRLDVAEVVADLVEVALRELADVLATIAVLGKRRVLAEELLRPRAHRDREVLDLLAGVVVVELARDRRALPLEQVGPLAPRQRRPPAIGKFHRDRFCVRTEHAQPPAGAFGMKAEDGKGVMFARFEQCGADGGGHGYILRSVFAIVLIVAALENSPCNQFRNCAAAAPGAVVATGTFSSTWLCSPLAFLKVSVSGMVLSLGSVAFRSISITW